jgi:hypothetical protein
MKPYNQPKPIMKIVYLHQIQQYAGGKVSMLILLSALINFRSQAQTTLSADGAGNTYELIDSKFGAGIEDPDCSHTSFGRHITEAFDSQLNKNVFVFHIHADIDNDRCTNFDRQRNEIKGGSGSPAAMQHTSGATAYERWKFKLDAGFIPSSRFTHIMQIKAMDGDAGAPLMTLTPRAGSPQKLQVIHSAGEGSGSQGTIAEVDLAPFKGTWVEAFMTYKNSEGSGGTFSLVIKRVSDGATLLSVSKTGIDMWRTGASYNRPKWGIYRGLDDVLRDEQVRFADFCITETAASQCPSSVGSALPSIGTGTTQAESLNRSNFVEELNYNGAASVVKPSSASTVGYVNGTFTGASGNYNVSVRYYDENDGAVTFTLKTNGTSRGSVTASANDETWKTWTVSNVTINTGHEIRIEGMQNSGEHGRVDYISISSTSARSTTEEVREQRSDAEVSPSDETILVSYPNPFTNKLIVKCMVTKAGPVRISIYTPGTNETSILIYKESVPVGTFENTFDTENLAKGLHVLKVLSNGKLSTQKVIKK